MPITLRGVDPRADKSESGHFELTYVDMRNGPRAGLRHSAPVDLVTNAAESTVVRNGGVAMAHDLHAVSELTHGGRPQDASRWLQRVRPYVGSVGAARPLGVGPGRRDARELRPNALGSNPVAWR